MVSCKHCSTPNSLDSTFCKRCGTALPAEDVQAAQEKLTALIAEGNSAFNEGKTDEAMAVAESAVASNPSSTAALSLKALCHERRGELAEALECADLIVDLNPDSELDKIKRNQLRTKLSVSVQLATQPPDRRSAMIGAVAAVVLMICLGIGAAKYTSRNAAAKSEPLVVQNPVISNPNTIQPNIQNPPASSPQAQQTPAPSVAQRQPDLEVQDPDQVRGTGRQGSGILPSQGEPGLSGNIKLQDDPLQVPNSRNTGQTAPTNPTIATPTSPSGTKSGSNDMSSDPPPAPDSGKAQQQSSDPGQVDIQISHGSRGTTFGGSASLGAGGVAALVKVGVQRYQLGSYGAAASSFDQALRAGGDQVTVNQWLGRCYGNMGRKSEQIDAYKRCVSACQSAISSGTGNKDRVKSIMDTCQQELKVLQGN